VPVLAGDNWGNSLVVEGFDAGPDTNTNASFNGVGPGYLRTMGIPLMAGREFTDADVSGAPKVAIINQAFAKKFNLGNNPIGKRFGLGGSGNKPDIEIVGLAQDAKYSDVKREVPPQYYLPYKQEERLGYAYFYVRTATPPEQLLATIPAAIRKLDAGLPLGDVMTMEQQIRENVTQDRLISTLSMGFALLATVLAAIGLYGVLAYTVAHGDEAGWPHGHRWRHRRAGHRHRRRPPGAITALRTPGPRSARPHTVDDRPGCSGARRRLHPGAARVENRSDERATL
jgi:hypothetical protein